MNAALGLFGIHPATSVSTLCRAFETPDGSKPIPVMRKSYVSGGLVISAMIAVGCTSP
jgi:hypothetical protein